MRRARKPIGAWASPAKTCEGSHPATEFVAWYNGQPDFRHHEFNLQVERAAVVGIGNVALDVARLLCLSREELLASDAADYAVDALANSRIKEVYLPGRRGPAQAAFTNPEIKEVGELQDADILTRADEIQLDELSAASIADDRVALKKVEILQGYAVERPLTKPKRLNLRFLVSPVELIGDANGDVHKMRLVRNTLVAGDTGSLIATPTDQFEEIEVGLVFRSVGYRGVPLPDVPFNERRGVILNLAGRVLDPVMQQPRVGEYTSGWIKRGPSGVVGTNKPDAVETVTRMLEDLRAGKILQPGSADAASIERLVRQRQPDYFLLRRLEAPGQAGVGERPGHRPATLEVYERRGHEAGVGEVMRDEGLRAEVASLAETEQCFSVTENA